MANKRPTKASWKEKGPKNIVPNFDNLKNECNPNHICANDEHEIKTTNFFS
jgi:hypothetical protein